MYLFVIVLTTFVNVIDSFDLSDVVFVILSQPTERHVQISLNTREKLASNLKEAGVEEPQIFDLQYHFPGNGGWTIFPLLEKLERVSRSSTKWFTFLHETSEVNVQILKTIFSKYDSDYGIFLGKPLNQNSFQYPDPLAGFSISRELFNNLNIENNEFKFHHFQQVIHSSTYFFSGAVHQLASFLENDDRFCTSYAEDCAIYPRDVSCKTSREKAESLVQKTLFAIRGCQALRDRLEVIHQTWSPAAYHMLIASDFEDPSNYTLILPGTQKNPGLCHRNLAIIQYFSQNYLKNDWKWLVIADDDTTLGVSKMMDLLQCYDGNDQEAIALGERYGYRVSGPESNGYNFLSGGGGMVFNRRAALKLSSGCSCPNADPTDRMDDVYLGMCIDQLKIPIIHTERMHQWTPEYYDPDLLSRQEPVSFHKYVNTDPLRNYDHYFRQSDQPIRNLKLKSKKAKEEL